MSKNAAKRADQNPATTAGFATRSYAQLDHRFTRMGTPIAAAGVGAAMGAGVGYALSSSMPTYAIGGAVIGVGIAELGRLAVDDHLYRVERARLATLDAAAAAAALFELDDDE